MKNDVLSITRTTKETDITMMLDFSGKGEVSVSTGVPFFDHLLTAMAFHGGFYFTLRAKGDIEADPHHLVEDTGIVLGKILKEWADKHGPIHRFGHAVIPMDEALSEITVDVSGRSHLVYLAEYPQIRCGDFDASLIKEFLLGLIRSADITVHGEVRYGDNTHHMIESLFKALGRSLHQAYSPSGEDIIPSTKGIL